MKKNPVLAFPTEHRQQEPPRARAKQYQSPGEKSAFYRVDSFFAALVKTRECAATDSTPAGLGKRGLNINVKLMFSRQAGCSASTVARTGSAEHCFARFQGRGSDFMHNGPGRCLCIAGLPPSILGARP